MYRRGIASNRLKHPTTYSNTRIIPWWDQIKHTLFNFDVFVKIFVSQALPLTSHGGGAQPEAKPAYTSALRAAGSVWRCRWFESFGLVGNTRFKTWAINRRCWAFEGEQTFAYDYFTKPRRHSYLTLFFFHFHNNAHSIKTFQPPPVENNFMRFKECIKTDGDENLKFLRKI